MATGKINVSVENIFPLIKKFLYSDHEIFLRELVSNAVDASQKLKVLTPLINIDMIPILAVSDDVFVWKTENQTTSTVNYQLKILASFNTKDKLAGIYQETIITNIKAEF